MGDVASSSSDEGLSSPSGNTDPRTLVSKASNSLSSPPSSQQNHLASTGEMFEHADDLQGGKGKLEKPTEESFVPGVSWNNKKAKDDYAKAWNMVEDRDFSLREFDSSRRTGFHS